MSKTVRSTLGALALVMFLPLSVHAQTKPAPAAPPAGGKLAVHPAAEARWNKLFQAAAVLAHEGMEVHRITAAEKKQIDDFVAQTRQFIAKAKQGGITEAEEDGIDSNMAQLYAMVARNVSDVQRKALAKPAATAGAAPAGAAPAGGKLAVHPAAEARWNKLFQAAAVLAHEGMEVRRITAAEKKQIDDFVGQTRQFIAKAKQGGITEAEEDGIDSNMAQLYAMVARNVSDVQRKGALVPAKK